MFIFCASPVFDSQYLELFHLHYRNLRIDYSVVHCSCIKSLLYINCWHNHQGVHNAYTLHE